MYADRLKHWMYAVYTYKKVYLKVQSHLYMQNYIYTYVCKYLLPLIGNSYRQSLGYLHMYSTNHPQFKRYTCVHKQKNAYIKPLV